ncbi:hypothetical protein GUITHDRAFT_105379 [Guillardia theta CCMP2712]|uniref:DNA recombination and repair protein Rad51-like C-terminal domain-containing protein n=1 Tax=Guillardia theta (strain CCMP2712) TaxID=905079 RepID=L1JKY4_GUITC|nr:hypothetical protein GUITHDRAFT_105379 [Guillardia theta CCMP2712]EKX48750.1 hypothetical protein GUITHDRAFT_105379 [Guillardia theta CCMP2712]|eukprot:XP_005835730.1 hypothetical protein GUITHDRAFT_105379 [Guillardia theta CCMP2712]
MRERPAPANCDTTALTFLRFHKKSLTFGVKELDRVMVQNLSKTLCLEICGSSACGKSELLLNACAQSVIPDEFQGIIVGGSKSSALFFCIGCTSSLYISRLVTLLDMHARKVIQFVDQSNLDVQSWTRAFILDCLSRIHFVVCYNAFEVFCAIRSMEDFLQCGNVQIVAFDCLSVLQWYSRVEQKAHEKEDSHGSSAQLDSCFLWLDSLAKQYNLIILASRWFTAKKSDALDKDYSMHKTNMMWEQMVTHRIVLDVCSKPGGQMKYVGSVKSFESKENHQEIEFNVTYWHDFLHV